jgi:DNA-binding XRE family transcriptional regulator
MTPLRGHMEELMETMEGAPFVIDDRAGRRIVVRTVSKEEVFVAIENDEETELARRPVPAAAEYQIPKAAGLMFVTDGSGFSAPDPRKLRAVMKRHGLTGSEVANIVGVNSRTLRKWTGGERQMPDAAWRLLLVVTGEVGLGQLR